MNLRQRSMIDRLTYVVTEAAKQCARAEPDQSKAPPVRPIVLAVLTAMREPTETMFMAGGNAEPYNRAQDGRLRGRRIGDLPARDCWRLMIDRALAEGGEP